MILYSLYPQAPPLDLSLNELQNQIYSICLVAQRAAKQSIILMS